jgi:hypothetical protein
LNRRARPAQRPPPAAAVFSSRFSMA